MPWFWLLKDDMHVFQQHNSLQLFHECDRCPQQSIEGSPTGGKASPTKALVPSRSLTPWTTQYPTQWSKISLKWIMHLMVPNDYPETTPWI